MNKASHITSNIKPTDYQWSLDSLQFLYDVTCSINSSENHSELLNNFLELITSRLGAHAAMIRLISDEDCLDLAASHGINSEQIEALKHTAIEGFLFSREQDAIKEVRRLPATTLINIADSETLAIPVRHNDHTLGVLNLLFRENEINIDDEQARLLITTGQHIGLAIEQFHADNINKQKLVQAERSMIANELHDSLAQTLASLRFQVRILDETLQPTSEYMAIMSIEQVENTLDEAYTDLRELIAHCRVPVEQQGLIPSINRVVSKFKEETGIHILLQCECQMPDIPANMEMHVYRIVQESLTNIKKHANAHIVRVLLSCDDMGDYRVLIENDGIGFDKEAIQSKEGQHLGLTIMQERAKHLGGELKIESDPDEGTRVELKFHYLREQTT